MMNNTFVVVPTYWTWASTDHDRPVSASYDHPTPLDGESTLPRLLDGLSAQLDKDFSLLVLVGQAHPDLGDTAAAHMQRLLAPYRDSLDVCTIDGVNWPRLRAGMDAAGLPVDGLHLGSYSGIRNLQLLIPHILGAEVIVALDDDECVEPDYIRRARRFVGEPMDGKAVLGLAGPYLQADGGFLLDVGELVGNVFLDKGVFINMAMRSLIDSKNLLSPAPLSLGGNMLFHHDCFTRIPFDPGITRGEDIDYLINARLQGIRWWFDAALPILHLPPKHYDTPRYQRMREDVVRFIYEREKLRLFGFHAPDWLEPYPGALLKETLDADALAALRAESTPEMVERFGTPDEILAQALEHAARHLPRFQPFLESWGKMMRTIEQDTPLRSSLVSMI